MIIFGPVSEAARGGHGNPFFDLLVGFFVLAVTWIRLHQEGSKQESHDSDCYRYKCDLRCFHLFRYRRASQISHRPSLRGDGLAASAAVPASPSVICSDPEIPA